MMKRADGEVLREEAVFSFDETQLRIGSEF